MSGFPLAGHVVFHSSDVDEARERVARIFCPHRLEPVRGGLDARHHSVRLKDISVNYVAYGGDVRIVPGPLRSFYVWQAPLSGTAEITCGSREIISRPGVASAPFPDEELSMRWSPDCAQLIVQADRAAVDEHLTATLGRELNGPLRPQLGWELRWGPGSDWWQLTRYLVNGIDRDATLLDHPLAVAHLTDGLLSGMLRGPHNYTRFIEADDPLTSQREVRHVVDLIQGCPEQPWTVTGLARHMGVSVRALQRAFRRYVGMRLMDCLKEARLRRAYAELLAAAPGDGVSVTEVVWGCGYTRTGRFAADYQRLHSETPWQTLHRFARPSAALTASTP